MIPIWAKDRNGKWHRFPSEHLRTFSDGKQGFKGSDRAMLPELWGLDFNMRKTWDYEPVTDRYTLKEESWD